MLALSVRQPYAEQILKGFKKIEYRSRSTSIRERVYIYASLFPANSRALDLPRGVIVGTVEIVNCVKKKNHYEWLLSKPHRFKRKMKPLKKPQPVWFYPF